MNHRDHPVCGPGKKQENAWGKLFMELARRAAAKKALTAVHHFDAA
jgi:hypothetical protein